MTDAQETAAVIVIVGIIAARHHRGAGHLHRVDLHILKLRTFFGKVRRYFSGVWYRRCRQRVCARCAQPIKRHHRWSAKTWKDGRPRHWSCDNPDLKSPPPISAESLGLFIPDADNVEAL